jgi:hypothetical protein
MPAIRRCAVIRAIQGHKMFAHLIKSFRKSGESSERNSTRGEQMQARHSAIILFVKSSQLGKTAAGAKLSFGKIFLRRLICVR